MVKQDDPTYDVPLIVLLDAYAARRRLRVEMTESIIVLAALLCIWT